MGRSTKIELFSNLSFPLDNSHVRRFASLSTQTAYFDSLPKTTLENFVYTRVDNYDFTFNVTGKIQGSQQWGYMRLKNLFDGNRWYYCFITKVEYVDDNTVKVYGSLDFYQTYVFDMTILESLVERQHEKLYQSNGLPVLNTVDEGLDYGSEYRVVSTRKVVTSSIRWLVIVSSTPLGGEVTNTYNVGTPTPLYHYAVPYRIGSGNHLSITDGSKTIEVLAFNLIFEKLQSDETIANSVISLYTTSYIGIDVNPYYDPVSGLIDISSIQGVNLRTIHNDLTGALIRVQNVETFEEEGVLIQNKYDGVPNYKESKLKCYPYTVLVLSDGKGNQVEYKPEFIDGLNLSFRKRGSIGTQSKVGYYLQNYLDNPIFSKEYILIDGNPNNIPILTDAVADYVQGNINSINAQKDLASSNRWVDVGSSIVNAIPLMMLPQTAPLGIAQATTGIAQAENRKYNDLKMLNAKKKDIENIPPNAQNMSGNTTYEWGNDLIDPIIHIKTVTPEYAKKLSDFFHMYGYQINELRIPNTHTRTHFNYVKCQSLNVRSGMNREIILRFKSIFENGVTLWHTNDIQNYNVSNEVI